MWFEALFADDTNLFAFCNDAVDLGLQIDASEKVTLLGNWFIAYFVVLAQIRRVTVYLVLLILTKSTIN